MLRCITRATRPRLHVCVARPIGAALLPNVTTRIAKYSTGPVDSKPTDPTKAADSSKSAEAAKPADAPKPAAGTSKPHTTNTKQQKNEKSGNSGGGGGGGGVTKFLSFTVIAAAAGAFAFYEVYQTRPQLIPQPIREVVSRYIPTRESKETQPSEPAVVEEIVPVAVVPVETVKIDAVPLESTTPTDLPVPIVPLDEERESKEAVPVELVPIEVVEIIPETVREVVAEPTLVVINEVVPEVVQEVVPVVEVVPEVVEVSPVIPFEITPEIINVIEVVETEPPSIAALKEEIVTSVDPDAADVLTPLFAELTEELAEKKSIEVPDYSIDIQAILKVQAQQIEELKDKLNQVQSEHLDKLDDRTKAHETAYKEVLALHDRIHRRELAEKLEQLSTQAEERLAQVTSQLKKQYEEQLQSNTSEAQAHYEQLLEQSRAEIQRNMEENLKAAIDNAQAQFSIRLAEEINKFDSKLVAELANEDAKYNASFNSRMKAIEKLRGEVTLLEAALMVNATKLKESTELHNVSAALFELSNSLSSPTRVSFLNELEKLEVASKALGPDPVVTTVAEVLRPIAAGGIVPYNELTERFKTVVASGRQAALVPEGGGMMDNLVAAVASKFIIPPKGPYVQGDSPEAIFAKAEYYLEHGQLSEVVTQLSQLHGMPGSIVRDWLQAASDRLVVENSVRALHSHLVDKANQQLVSQPAP